MTEDTPLGSWVSIGELARVTGLPVRTIRFYCDEGILESRRSTGGHRMFDADSAAERLRTVRRLRALDLGLTSIAEVLRGENTITAAIATESARVDAEFESLAWRRASLRAVGASSPTHRAERLTLLAAAQDARTVHDHLAHFWRRVLTPIPESEIAAWVCWNVPPPPEVPSVEDVLAYAELAALATDPELNSMVRQQYWRCSPESIRDGHRLYAAVGEVTAEVVPLVRAGAPPSVGHELDRYVRAHARARGRRDSRHFRRQLLTAATDADPRIHRWWTLTDGLLADRVTIGRAHDWVYNALAQSIR